MLYFIFSVVVWNMGKVWVNDVFNVGDCEWGFCYVGGKYNVFIVVRLKYVVLFCCW